MPGLVQLANDAMQSGLSSSDSSSAGWLSGIDNFFTGNLDYKRSLEQMEMQNRFNAEEAQKSRDWQERMSNTSYQRAVADLKAAGLNPYLAYQQGGATAGGATAARSGQGGNLHSGQGFSSLFSLLLGTMNNATKIANQAMYNQTLKDTAAIRADTAYDIAYIGRNGRRW